MQIWALIADSFRESRDRKLFWILLGISTIMAGALACIGYDENGWSLFFGAVKIPAESGVLPLKPAQVYGAIVSHALIDVYLGWIGTLLALVATAGFFPSFMARGRIDVLLSKPMSRVGLFFGKYLGSLSFVLVQAAYFVGLTLLVLRGRTGEWLWPYLWAIPLLLALFSYLYCVTVLISMWARSGMTCLVLTLLFWMSVAGINTADNVMRLQNFRPDLPMKSWSELSSLAKSIHVVNAVLPKTSHIPTLLSKAMHAADISDMGVIPAETAGPEGVSIDAKSAEQAEKAAVTPLRSVGGSLAFEAVVLIIAGWWFSRRDF